jgi:hypothetical protein
MRLFAPKSAFRGIRGGLVARPIFAPECNRASPRFYTTVANRTYDVCCELPPFLKPVLTNLQDAVDLLNSLQTPYAALKKRRAEGFIIDKTANEEMRKCLTSIGYSVNISLTSSTALTLIAI